MNLWLVAAALTSSTVLSAGQHRIEGAENSRVCVIIYEDLQCPDCAYFRSVLDEQLLPRYGASVRFEHRDFPLARHAWARKAAIGARFLDEAQPGAGLAFRKFTMANQDQITAGNFEAIFVQFAEARGLDAAKTKAALGDPRLSGLVEKDRQEGAARGVTRTPTVFVNGRPFIENFTFEELSQAIEAERVAAKLRASP